MMAILSKLKLTDVRAAYTLATAKKASVCELFPCSTNHLSKNFNTSSGIQRPVGGNNCCRNCCRFVYSHFNCSLLTVQLHKLYEAHFDVAIVSAFLNHHLVVPVIFSLHFAQVSLYFFFVCFAHFCCQVINICYGCCYCSCRCRRYCCCLCCLPYSA